MENKQELEWAEAQKIVISQDLVAAAKQQLKFLAAVDRNRRLYAGPALNRAIYRYKYCWLPLLAKHAESEVSESPLVVPLDCEWIWHCHRLNPVRYKADCKEIYGKILGNRNVVSSVQGSPSKPTEAFWKRMCPNEPYELDLSNDIPEDVGEDLLGALKSTKYDLVSAVKRQSTFFFQISRPCMNDDFFLEGAVARYKGFLHLIKRNRERAIKQFCVPTYDIDLVWHSHQLHPVSYCKDLVALLGKVLTHDDTDSDRSKGRKLDVGFSGTTKQWEEAFGSRYWRAGAMYKGSAPTPLDINFSPSSIVSKKEVPLKEFQDMIQLPKTMLMEVMVEIVGVKNLPVEHKGNVVVSLGKKQPDMLFKTLRRISILSESGEKDVAAFQCEPTGGLFFELMSYSSSNLPTARTAKILGTTLISLKDILNPVSTLSIEKWFKLTPRSGIVSSEQPISLRIAFSFTAPIPAPYVLHMIQTRPFSGSSCSFSIPGGIKHAKSWTSIIDEAGNEVFSITMRETKKEVAVTTPTGETHLLAEVAGAGWSMMDSHWFLQLHKTTIQGGQIFELSGCRKVLIFPGRKLEYETKICKRDENESDFMTIIEFSADDPHGKAVAMLNLRCGLIKIKEEWLLLPGIILAFILSDIMRKNGYNGFSSKEVDVEVKLAGKASELISGDACKYKGGCGHECEAVENSGACGGCSGCGGCGGCSGGCSHEAVENSGACGGWGGCGGCSGGCSHEAVETSGACGGCSGCGGCGGCSGGCSHENMAKNSVSEIYDPSGGCGGCSGGCGGGGGCSNKLVDGSI